LGEFGDGGGVVDAQDFQTGDGGEVLEDVDADGGAHHSVVGAAGGEPRGCAGGEVGFGLPDGAADGQVR